MTTSVQFLVSGRVQGVGYRRFVQKQAQELQLTGWTRNLTDGRVQVHAQGSQEKMDELEARLRRGPLLSSVREVLRTESEPRNFSAFEVLADAESPEKESMRR